MLVEQTYGEGAANQVAEAAGPLRLGFERQGAQIQGRIRAGDDDAQAHSWPRLFADASRRIDVEEQRYSIAGDRVRARYRVDPAPGDDLVLVVTEEYSVVEKGRALVGTVRVEFQRDGKERGSYVLRRRFEREP
jgi:hypothetical protein